MDPDYAPGLGTTGSTSCASSSRSNPATGSGAPHLRAEEPAWEEGMGEVAWDTEITNQTGETVASYDVAPWSAFTRSPIVRREA